MKLLIALGRNFLALVMAAAVAMFAWAAYDRLIRVDVQGRHFSELVRPISDEEIEASRRRLEAQRRRMEAEDAATSRSE